MPIILDETFAHFDDNRLKNVLEFLSANYKNKQIIIFSCTKREVEILKQMEIKYNRLVLQ